MKITSHLLLAAATLVAASSAHAADGTWITDLSTSPWTTTTNWAGGTVADGSGFTANFTNDITANRTVTLSAAKTIGNIVFDDAGATGDSAWTISGSTLTLAGTTPTITTNTNATISSIIAGTAGLTKTGAGTLTISSASNSYTGLTTVSQGRLLVSGTGTLGANSNTFVDFGATLQNASTAAWNGALTGTGTVEITTNSKNFGGDNSAFAGDIKVLSGGGRVNFGASNSGSANAKWIVDGITAAIANVTIDMGSLEGASTGSIGAGGTNTVAYSIGALNTNTTYSGTILGSSNNHTSIVKVGTGTLTLTNTASAYDRSTTINAGTLEVKKVAAGGAQSSIGTSTNVASNLVINGGVLKFSGITGDGSTDRLFTIGVNGATIDASSTDNTALTFTNTGALATTAGATNRTLTLTGSTASATSNSIAALIIDPTGGGKTAVTKSGSNAWVLTGANTYTGGTTLTSGFLRAASGALGSGLLTINGGTLTGSGNSSTTSTFGNAVLFGGNAAISASGGFGGVNFTNTVDLGGATRTITVGQTTVTGATFGGVVSNGGITKAGAGALTLSAANTYTGGTTVNAGTLTVAASTGSIQVGNAGVTVAASATLAVDGKLVLTAANATIANAGTIDFAASGASIFAGTLFDGLGGNTYQLISNTGAGNIADAGSVTFDLTGSAMWTSASLGNTGLITFTAVPEPSTYGLIGAGALAAVAFVRRRRKHAGKVA